MTMGRTVSESIWLKVRLPIRPQIPEGLLPRRKHFINNRREEYATKVR